MTEETELYEISGSHSGDAVDSSLPRDAVAVDN